VLGCLVLAFGPKAEYHCECLAYVAFMGEHKLLFAAKALHVPWNELILKRSVNAWKMLYPPCLCLKCLTFHTWVPNMLHDVHQWRSLPEVDTWLMSFNMTCFALWVFAMIFCWELDILVWSLDDMHIFGLNMTWIGFYIWSEPSFDIIIQIWKFALSHAYISIYYLWQCFDYVMIHICALCLISSLCH
jgi:hypothetical protein